MKIGRPRILYFGTDTSEAYHQRIQDHFQEKISHEIFRKTPEEREALNTAIRQHKGKNHAPDNSEFNRRQYDDGYTAMGDNLL